MLLIGSHFFVLVQIVQVVVTHVYAKLVQHALLLIAYDVVTVRVHGRRRGVPAEVHPDQRLAVVVVRHVFPKSAAKRITDKRGVIQCV